MIACEGHMGVVVRRHNLHRISIPILRCRLELRLPTKDPHPSHMQQKKIGTEFTYVSRFVWVDFEKKQLGWSKTSTKDGEHKTLDLTKSTVSVAGDVVSIKEEEYAHIVQLKVSYR